MILIEFGTTTGKHIAFASNGVLSIKHEDSDLAFSKISKQQAHELAFEIMKWADAQPDDQPTIKNSKPYYGDDPECVPGN